MCPFSRGRKDPQWISHSLAWPVVTFIKHPLDQYTCTMQASTCILPGRHHHLCHHAVTSSPKSHQLPLCCATGDLAQLVCVLYVSVCVCPCVLVALKKKRRSKNRERERERENNRHFISPVVRVTSEKDKSHHPKISNEEHSKGPQR